MRLILIISILTVNTYCKSQLVYPFPLQKIQLTIENKNVSMAYMDIKPPIPDPAKNILLLHGKNFNGYYWKELIPLLTAAGYRVIVPDQLGWGESDRVNLHYSFHMLANNTRLLLLQLGIKKAVVLGHSMGGMLATRFALMFPEMTAKLILEDPIGLEDYKTFVPYQSVDSLYEKERTQTYDSYKKYQETYYPVWQPRYEQYVAIQAKDLVRSDLDTVALVNAITYQMIYEQPVCYEFSKLKISTLLVIGQADRTVVGKEKLTAAEKTLHGNYPVLGKNTPEKISGSVLKSLPGIGHIPHVQDINMFWESIQDFLK